MFDSVRASRRHRHHQQHQKHTSLLRHRSLVLPFLVLEEEIDLTRAEVVSSASIEHSISFEDPSQIFYHK